MIGRLCLQCGSAGPFYASQRHATACKECVKERALKWKAENEVRAREHKRRSRLKQYGLTEMSYRALLASQGNACAICGAEEGTQQHRDGRNGQARPANSLSVDHDHDTGAVRGLLCDHCNHGLGKFADDPERLERAARYLRVPPAPSVLVLAPKWQWGATPTKGDQLDLLDEAA